MNHIILGLKDVGVTDLKSGDHYGIGFHNLETPVETIGDEVATPKMTDLHTVITSVSLEGLEVLKAGIDRAIKQWQLDHPNTEDEVLNDECKWRSDIWDNFNVDMSAYGVVLDCDEIAAAVNFGSKGKNYAIAGVDRNTGKILVWANSISSTKPYFGDIISLIKKKSKLLGVAVDPSSPLTAHAQELEEKYGIYFESVFGVMSGASLLKANAQALKLFEDNKLLFQSNNEPSNCIDPHGMVFGNLKAMLMSLYLLDSLLK